MYVKPSKRRKLRLRQRLILIIAIAAAAVVCLFFLFRGGLPAIRLGGGSLIDTGRSLPQTAMANENGILYLDDGTLYLLNTDGSESWTLPLDMEGASLASSDALICAYTDKSIKLMEYTREQLFANSFDATVDMAACGQNYVAILTETQEEGSAQSKQIVYILDREGGQAGQIEFTSKRVVDFGFHGDTDSFWVLTLDSSGIVPSSYVATYKPDGVQTGTIEINTQIVQDVYMADSLIFISGTNSIMTYTKFGQKENEVLIYGWTPYAASISGDSAVFAYVPISAAHSLPMTHLYFTDLSETAIHLPQNVFAVAVTQDRCLAFSKDEIFTYGTDGSFIKSEKLEVEISSAKQLSGSIALVWDVQDNTYIVQLG